MGLQHGGSVSRKDKEAHFEKAVQLLAPIARQVLTEINTSLLRDTGQLTETGLRRTEDGGLSASWTLSWPEQRAARVPPIALQAYFGGGFHHPHLRGTTVYDWPLNVFSDEDAVGPAHVLAIAPDGDLWVGTDGGLQRIVATALNQFGDLPATVYHPGPGLGSRIICLHFSRSGILWVGTAGGLYRFERGGFSSVIPRLGIFRIEEASNGHLLVITSEGFMEWDGEGAVPHPEFAVQLDVKTDEVFHVFEDSHGVTWFCTRKGVARRTGGSFEKIAPYGPKGHGAFRVYEDPQGNVWLATAEGLFRGTATGLELAVPGMNVRYIYGDRDGDLWIGTNGDRLFRFKDRVVRMFTTADGLPNNVIMTVLATRDGSLWAGANCGNPPARWFVDADRGNGACD